jgi:flagellar protein FliO/FliZ
MLESLFGAEMPLALRFFIAFVVMLGVIGVTAWVVRRFGVERRSGSGTRGRQVRLAVIDAVEIHGRRRLVLIRRDNVEHLLMIGGPTDLVVEPNIVRAAAAREAALPARAGAAADALARAPIADGGQWPLQAEPPAARPPRIPVPVAHSQESTQWPAEPELPALMPRRRAPDPLAGLAAELSRDRAPERETRDREVMREREPPMRERERERETAHEPTPLRVRELMREREPGREREPMGRPEHDPPIEREPIREQREAAPAPAQGDPEIDAGADQNLADMAQRLEAALRRPARVNEARPTDAAARAMTAELEAARAPASPGRAPAAAPSPPRPEPKPEPKSAKSVYDSLEKEMASLLGRPNEKS